MTPGNRRAARSVVTTAERKRHDILRHSITHSRTMESDIVASPPLQSIHENFADGLNHPFLHDWGDSDGRGEVVRHRGGAGTGGGVLLRPRIPRRGLGGRRRGIVWRRETIPQYTLLPLHSEPEVLPCLLLALCHCTHPTQMEEIRETHRTSHTHTRARAACTPLR